jgi:hypothetical protein
MGHLLGYTRISTAHPQPYLQVGALQRFHGIGGLGGAYSAKELVGPAVCSRVSNRSQFSEGRGAARAIRR